MVDPTSACAVECKIGGKPYGNLVTKFEWKSMVNGGYIIKVTLRDNNFELLDSLIEGTSNKGYLDTGRQYDEIAQKDSLSLVTFKLSWVGGAETKERIALISNVYAYGGQEAAGNFQIIAVDPISYFVNAGDCSGKTYYGRIGGKNGVISQVLNDYVPPSIGGLGVQFNVGETNDQKSTYCMMRQDPKTFIASLLEWSSSFTANKTSWIVANGQDESGISIDIKESWTPQLKFPVEVAKDDGPLILSGVSPNTPNIFKWELMADNFMSAVNTKVLTSGISVLSGEYFDRISDNKEEIVFVKDENTSNKVNPSTSKDQSFTKPTKAKKGWTYVSSLPEFSAGDIGHKYNDYISGRARQAYMNMLNLLMRMKLTVRGQPRLFDSTELGRVKVGVSWLGRDSKPRFMNGDWLLYGWHHIYTVGKGWFTDAYISRLDYNAASLPGARGAK